MGRVTIRLDDLPLRDDLRGLQPYGAPQAPLPVALNVNENTHPVPREVADDILDAVGRALGEINRYPDREFRELRAAFADYLRHGLIADQIWAANGSNEVLQHVLQAFGGPGRRALGFAPTYSMYPLLTRATGAEWVSGSRGADYTLDAESAVEQISAVDPDIVFLCAPNNPTGTPLSLDVIEAAYEATRGIVIVDEAYFEFAPHTAPSALALLPGRERLLVSRTMSKAFAFAGARVGYLAADPAVIDALPHAPVMLQMVDEIIAQRDRISATVEALGYRAYESWTNFVLFSGVDDPGRTWQQLYDRGILVRDIGIPRSLRVSAGTAEETTAFLEALASIDSRA